MAKKKKTQYFTIGSLFVVAGMVIAAFGNKGLAGAFLGSGLTLIILEFLKKYEIRKK